MSQNIGSIILFILGQVYNFPYQVLNQSIQKNKMETLIAY